MCVFDKVYKHYSAFPIKHWRWPNFTPAEVACRDGSLMVNEDAMDKLQALRDLLGFPLIVLSAYRSPEHNANIGGVVNSHHTKACAFDVLMFGIDPVSFEKAARQVGFTGFGFYPEVPFMHIDIGRPRFWGYRWNGIIFSPTGLLPEAADHDFIELLEGEDEMRNSEFITTKPWWQSNGVLGSIVAIGSAGAALIGIVIGAPEQSEIGMHITAITGGLGGLWALYGRIVAKSKIGE